MAVPKVSQFYYIKHKQQPNFSAQKFTPSVIHNKKNLDQHVVISYFLDNHPLKDCATYFGCAEATIKRKLRAWGIDTSIYNHSKIAVDRTLATKKSFPLTNSELYELYVTRNLDSKTIAEMYGLHYNTVRLRTRKYKKNPVLVAKSMQIRHQIMYGCRHPAQRQDVLLKTRRSSIRIRYLNKSQQSCTFRSLSELSYALLLDRNDIEWAYEEMRIPYVDMMNGKSRIYVIDFTVLRADVVEWIEIKPHNKMIPEDKRIYAMRRAEEAGVIYRGLTDEERQKGWELLQSGYRYDNIEFIYSKPRVDQSKITYWFKDQQSAIDFKMVGWKQFTKPTANGKLWKKILVRI